MADSPVITALAWLLGCRPVEPMHDQESMTTVGLDADLVAWWIAVTVH